jgi:hypothetical protein
MEDPVGWKLNEFVVNLEVPAKVVKGKSWRYQGWGDLPAKALLEVPYAGVSILRYQVIGKVP